MQPQRYLCRKSKLASECDPLFTYLLFDRPISMFLTALLHLLQCNIQMSMNENGLCMLVVTKTAKVSGVGLDLDHAGLGLGLGLPGLGLGLGLSGLGLVLVSDSLVLITSLEERPRCGRDFIFIL